MEELPILQMKMEDPEDEVLEHLVEKLVHNVLAPHKDLRPTLTKVILKAKPMPKKTPRPPCRPPAIGSKKYVIWWRAHNNLKYK